MRLQKLFTYIFQIVCVLFLLQGEGYSQPETVDTQEKQTLINFELERYRKSLEPRQPQSLASHWFDVTYYHLNLTVTFSPSNLDGLTIIEGTTTESGQEYLFLDLADPMLIEYITINDTLTSYQQFAESFKVDLLHPTLTGEMIRLAIKYRGLPVSTGFGSCVFGTHSDLPWVWTLSEPYGAKDWFPCNNDPNDKADSVDITVTVDSSYSVASNGRLAAVLDNADGTRTFCWQERYPIAPYLICFSAANYVRYSHWFQYSDTDSMEVMNFVLPEHYAQAETSLIKTVRMLKIFSRLFGLYPFVNEKFGHADFGFGGAMEHQTITSTTTYQEGVLAHEAAHQWFGDMITLQSWRHLWLNEGFAQYGEALYMEQQYGDTMYRKYIGGDFYKARTATGSIYVSDTSVVRTLFDAKLVYSKASVVLHMLRHVLGDSVFFRVLYSYANNPTFRYANASTEDFQTVCETISGKSLDYFFKEWIYGEKFPSYTYWWRALDTTGGYTVQLGVRQTTGTTNPAIFTMPVDISFEGDGVDTTLTVLNSQSLQYYSFTLGWKPDSVKLDQDGWILKNVTEISSDGQPFPTPYHFSLNQNYPNPFNASTTISYSIKQGGNVTVKVYSLLGTEVATLVDRLHMPGDYTAVWDATNLSTGLYLCRISSGGLNLVKPMMLIR